MRTALLFLAFTQLAQAQQDPGEWGQTVFLYGMAAMIQGEAQAGNLSVPVDVSLSDFFDVLKFGADVRYWVDSPDRGAEGLGLRMFATRLLPRQALRTG